MGYYEQDFVEWTDDELQHHGTKGMKWGRRLYQNKDGSLTALGQKRYNKEVGKLKSEKAKLSQEKKVLAAKKKTQSKLDKLEADKKKLEEQKKALKEEKKRFKNGEVDSETKKEETPEERKDRLLKSTDAKELYKHKDELSSNEINDRINRIDLENRLQSKIVQEQKKSGLDYVNDKLETFTKTYKNVDNAYSTVANSAIGKTLAKKLGLEPPKKDFDLGDFMKNINSKSAKEIQEASQRIQNEKKLRDEMNRREKEANKAKEEKKNKKNKEESSDTKETSEKKTEESKTETWEGTVEGVGTSSSRFNKSSNNTNKKPDDYYDPIDMEVPVSGVPAVYRRSGQTWVAGYLEDLSR